MYTFVDSLNKLSSLLGDSNSTDNDFWPLSIRKKELNRGECLLAVDSKDLMGYESGVLDSSNVLTLPSDWIETHVLYINNRVITNDREISITELGRYINWAGDVPYYYFWTDGAGTFNINLIGNVDQMAYKLFYFKKPTVELDATTDMSLHQEQFREATAYYAASELIRQVGKNVQADEYRAIYEAGALRADAWARKLYINKEYARPDFGQSDTCSGDFVGQGSIY